MAEGPDRFRVVCPPQQLGPAGEWAERAADAGTHDQFLDMLRTIHESLATAPLDWGDPLYRLGQVGLVVCHRIYSALHVNYAVDEGKRVVYLREIRLAPERPLGASPDR